MRKKGKVIACLLLSLSLLGGCSNSNSNTTSEASASPEVQVSAEVETTEAASDSQSTEGTSIYGQVTAIDGSTLTIALAEQPQMMGGGDGTAPSDMPEGGDGTAPSDMPEGGDGTAPSDIPEGGDGTAPSDMPEGGDGAAQGDGSAPQQEVTLTGETQDITVSDSTTITVNGETASIEDISTDDIVTVQMSGDEVVSISVGFGGGQGPDGATSVTE